MHRIINSHHPFKHLKSFKYAFIGLKYALVNEANFRIQVLFLIACIILGLFFELTKIEWLLLIMTNGILLSSEILNTVIEEFMDHLIQDHHEGVRVIKDLSAAFVLISAFVTLFVFFTIFADKIFVS